jgi:ATP-dependent exoDNAse (exonuclease V) beta subunit
MSGHVLPDDPARERIKTSLERTLFVEAGAGSGKTSALVQRIVATVLDAGLPVPLRHIAAVTFTEKAAAELRDRLRAAFEQARTTAGPGSARGQRADVALEDLDEAAIGTVHSFARRILAEHPIEAGLPPLLEVLDEVASSVEFENRWTALRAELLDEPALTPSLLMAMAVGLKLDDLRTIARAFTGDWDLIAPRVLAQPEGGLPTLAIDEVVREARRIAELARHCTDADDRFLERLDGLSAWADGVERAVDEPARLAALAAAANLKWSYGRVANWTGYGLEKIKQECAACMADAAALCAKVGDVALRRIARRLGEATLEAAEERRSEGKLEFHDLLVLARNLLRSEVHGAGVRATLAARYRRILLDEFQDTDPIQIELAVRIAGGVTADAPSWTDVAVPEGSLFVVGDPKQSIYRFRRADIGTYLEAQSEIGSEVVLSTNFRTVEPVLKWVNFVFGQLIQPEPGSQPGYRALDSVRPAAPAGPPIVVLGVDAHSDKPSADDMRAREAADVVASVQAAIAERWQVADDGFRSSSSNGAWRDVKLSDIAVLVPARTSLPHLEAAFDKAGVPYRAEASSLVYRTREVRDLLTAARAADDPSDGLALVSALRSPMFGCGDDELWTWYQAGGRWNLLAPVPDSLSGDHAVAGAVTYLRKLHNARTWLAPSEVLARLVDDRRMYEVAAGFGRSRDVWRRLRFVVDHARAWSEAEHGSLRDYLAWAARQGDEASRVAEAVLPETDADTVRIMTIHAAKGLEFPVVIVSGMSSQPGGGRPGVQVLWPRTGGYEIKMGKSLQTLDFEVAKPIDEQMSHHERLRLLYVACTRARDHLVVSLHRRTRSSKEPPEDARLTSAELLAAASVGAPSQVGLAVSGAVPAVANGHVRVEPPPSLEDWRALMATVRASAAHPAALSASELEGTLGSSVVAPAVTDRLGEPADPGLAKDARDLELPPWNKGRYGTAIGRAVHGVLQTVDLVSGAGLSEAVAAQVLAEGVVADSSLVEVLAQAALTSPTVQRAAERQHWRETYVGTEVGDRVLEGFVDLVYRDDDGLVIVDYKTDAAPVSALDVRVAFYRPQMAAYAAALSAATGQPIARGVLVFLSPSGAIDREVDDLTVAMSLTLEAATSSAN